jgi:L-seryl-tRNA(Ser) seleniumtransferase
MATSGGSRAQSPDRTPNLRGLPSVELLAESARGGSKQARVDAARQVLDAWRDAIGSGREREAPSFEALAEEVGTRLATQSQPNLRRVLNATGVIVHTNLGRAPLARSAIDAVAELGLGYSNLEYDLTEGGRGQRNAHIEELLTQLCQAEAALVVNNCAAAVLLATAALAGGHEVVISRGQLIEIGGSFRIPEVVAQSGARLAEVGTTNKTRPQDYERAITDDTHAIMRAHPSNFRTVGFVAQPEIEELCEIAARHSVYVIDDLGSGKLFDDSAKLEDEPAVVRSVRAGSSVTCFSGDKLLGGPQAGIMVGSHEAISMCREHPLARALRIDKLSLAALEATLRLYQDPDRLAEIPVLSMLRATPGELSERAWLIKQRLQGSGIEAEITQAVAKLGGGALPLLDLEGPVCALRSSGLSATELATRLRAHSPPVIGRIQNDWLLLDPRTLTDAEAEQAASAVLAVSK